MVNNNNNLPPLNKYSILCHNMTQCNKVGLQCIVLIKLAKTQSDLHNLEKKLRKKMKQVVIKYPHLTCNIINDKWSPSNINYEQMIYFDNKSSSEIINTQNKSFNATRPAWRIVISNDNNIVVHFDHVYGDAAFFSNICREWLTDDSLNNVTVIKSNPEDTNNISFLSKIILFFKSIYLFCIRMINHKRLRIPNNNFVKHSHTTRLAKISLTKLNAVRERLGIKTGNNKMTINTILHSIIVKTVSTYFNKDTVFSGSAYGLHDKDDINTNNLNNNNNATSLFSVNKVNIDTSPFDLLNDVKDSMQFHKLWINLDMTIRNALYKIFSPLNNISVFKRIGEKINEYIRLFYSCAITYMLTYSSSLYPWDFSISNYVIQYKNKTLFNNNPIKNISAMITPSYIPQTFSIITYGDTINIYYTCNTKIVTNLKKLKKHFRNATRWLLNI